MDMQESPEVIIVGGGPSGLAVAACLHELSVPYIIIEREDCFAPLWKKNSYERLHLHLPRNFCELPHMSFPASYPKYVPRKEFIQYLNDYASRFDIRPLCRRRVESAAYDGRKWNVKVNDALTGEEELYSSRFLIVATGETSDPFIPEIEGLSSFPGERIHSTEYKNGAKYRNENVLVVGSGNSGMEISLDLSNYGAKTSVVVRSPVHVVTRGMAHMGLVLLKYLPCKAVDALLVAMSWIVYGDLTPYGIRRPQPHGPFASKVISGKYPVIDSGIISEIKSGQIQVLPGITSMTGNNVEFENGKSYPFDAIIFATGFKRSTHLWLRGDNYLLNEDGLPKPSFPNHWKGRDGLYCAGLARRGLYGAAMDAQNIADDIVSLLNS